MMNPRTHLPSWTDYSLAWHLLNFVVPSGLQRGAEDDELGTLSLFQAQLKRASLLQRTLPLRCFVTSNLCEHLEHLGLWHLAVLVAMHLCHEGRPDLDAR